MKLLKLSLGVAFVALFSVACATPDKAATRKDAAPANGNSTAAATTTPANPNQQAAQRVATSSTDSGAAATLTDAEVVKLYTGKCAMCHGSTGRGATPGTPDLTSAATQGKKTVADFAETIKSGKKPLMPGFASQLSEAEIQALAAYVYALAKK